jgi:hypothetical protein
MEIEMFISEIFIEEVDAHEEYRQRSPNDNLPVGRHNDLPDQSFDQEQLDIGTDVEKEHTDDVNLAKAICKDHLREIPDYYIRLNKMEKEAIKEQGYGI